MSGIDPDSGNICATGTASGGAPGGSSEAGGISGSTICFYLPSFCSRAGGGAETGASTNATPNPGVTFSVTTYARTWWQSEHPQCTFTSTHFLVCDGKTVDLGNVQVQYGAVPRLSSLTPAIYAVYIGISQNGQRYIGITSDLARRAAQHAQNGIRIIQTASEELTYFEAKAAEQVLIGEAGLANLANKINSIAASNPLYQTAITTGRQVLGLP